MAAKLSNDANHINLMLDLSKEQRHFNHLEVKSFLSFKIRGVTLLVSEANRNIASTPDGMLQ